MRSSVLVFIFMLLVGGASLRYARASRLRRVAVGRLDIQVQSNLAMSEALLPEAEDPETYPRRFYWAPPAVGLAAAIGVYFLTDLPVPYAVGSAILLGSAAHLFEAYWADQSVEKIEAQLADTIDLMVSALRAGSSLVAALEATVKQAKDPLRLELETMVARIRVGDDPRVVVRELALRVPLESFRLFTHSLLIHWDTGGSRAASLRTVGRTVRDRLEVSRRISAQAIESQVSVVAVLGISYGLLAFMNHANPEPSRKFLYSAIGSYGAAAVMLLQAIGMIWIWRMSRIRF